MRDNSRVEKQLFELQTALEVSKREKMEEIFKAESSALVSQEKTNKTNEILEFHHANSSNERAGWLSSEAKSEKKHAEEKAMMVEYLKDANTRHEREIERSRQSLAEKVTAEIQSINVFQSYFYAFNSIPKTSNSLSSSDRPCVLFARFEEPIKT